MTTPLQPALAGGVSPTDDMMAASKAWPCLSPQALVEAWLPRLLWCALSAAFSFSPAGEVTTLTQVRGRRRRLAFSP